MKSYRILVSKPSCVLVASNFIDERIDSSYYRSQSLEDLKTVTDNSECDNISRFFDVSKLAGFEYTRYFTQENLAKGTVVALTSQNVLENEIDFSNVMKIPVDIHNTLSRSIVKPGDILLSYTGQYRRACVVPENLDLHLGPNICRLRKKKKIDEYYISTFLNSRYGQSILDREKTVSAQPTVNMGRIRKIPIPIPSPEVQKYIGEKVRRAEELREESKKSKKKYECIIKDIYCDTDAKKFPSGIYFVNNYDFDEKSLRIDSNFYHPLYNYENIKCKHIIKLSELAKLKKNSKIMAKEEYIYYEIGDLSTSKVLEDKERIMGSKLPGRAKLELRMNDIIISLVQESIEVTSYVDMKLKNALTTNGCAVLEPKDKSLSAYLYAIMSSEFFIAQKCKYISGTNIRSMSKDDLLDMSIPIVEQKIIDKIVELVNIEFSNIRKAKQLIQKAKQDVEDLIEGKFDMSKLNETTTESR
ncbi:restriction endonuclease subunit S [Clostridium cochlearium]|uniref:restriction endonuclease subunit S n=1 Tax=Clostridium cochlearium TaxID=1494 RepID=UPI0016798D77|nr:restriction endonuclease subunit S [Clostridium cochlearium]